MRIKPTLSRIRRNVLRFSTVILIATASIETSAAPSSAIDKAATSTDSATLNDAQQMILSASARYRQDKARTNSDYKAKKAECDNLQGNAKKACAADAKVARNNALANATVARKKTMNEAYAKAPELMPALATPRPMVP